MEKERRKNDTEIPQMIMQERSRFEEYARGLIERKRAQENDVRLLERFLEKGRLNDGPYGVPQNEREAYKCSDLKGTSLPSLQRATTEAMKIGQAGRLAQNERLGLVW